MPTKTTCLLTLLLLARGACPAGAADRDLPLGHPDFRPSPERPVGWRGDGNGAFPGATVPGPFLEGTLVDQEVTLKDGRSGTKTRKRHFLEAGPATGLVWKTPMPGWTNSTPIVVGDRVFTMAEPYTLICCDAASGAILWQADNNPFLFMGKSPAEAEELYVLCEVLRACQSLSRWIMVDTRGKNGEDKLKAYGQEVWGERYDTVEAALTRARPIAKRLAPELDEDFAKALQNIAQRRQGRGDGELDFDANRFQQQYGLRTYDAWMGMIGWTFPTPCSDGERVYIACGQGQVAAYDLDGKRLWARFLPIEDSASKRARAQHVPSPVLCRGVLIVQAADRLHGLDAATGRSLWQVESAVDGGYRCGTGKTLVLGDLPVFVTTKGEVIGVRDGKLLAELPAQMCGSESGGSSVIGSEDRVYFRSGGNGGGPMRCFRLRPEGAAVAFELVWEDPESKNCKPTDILYEDRIYQMRDGVLVRDALTGKILAAENYDRVAGDKIGGCPSSIIAGQTFVAVCDTQGFFREFPGDALFATFGLAPLAEVNAGGIGKHGWTVCMLGGPEMKPRVRCLERYAKALYDQPDYSHYTIPAQFGYGHPFAQGSRLYIRSTAYLYCVGR